MWKTAAIRILLYCPQQTSAPLLQLFLFSVRHHSGCCRLLLRSYNTVYNWKNRTEDRTGMCQGSKIWGANSNAAPPDPLTHACREVFVKFYACLLLIMIIIYKNAISCNSHDSTSSSCQTWSLTKCFLFIFEILKHNNK